MSYIRGLIRGAAYVSGALTTLHRIQNAHHLTTAMLHRVLPRGAAAWDAADPEYTLAADVFADALSFLADNYNIVSLKQLNAAQVGGPGLPEHPLLITFDDGWSDTLDHAAGPLQKRRLPAVCFVASDAVDDESPDWWQDTFTAAWRRQRVGEKEIIESWSTLGHAPIPDMPGVNAYLRCLMMLQELPADTRKSLLEPHRTFTEEQADRQMLSSNRVRMLVTAGIEIGAHGASHLPITMCRNALQEMSRSRLRLTSLIAATSQCAVTAMSFPHGRYNADAVQAARGAGYKLLFTSKPTLSRLKLGRPESNIHGRIQISSQEITDASGRFRADRMATYLFRRPAD